MQKIARAYAAGWRPEMRFGPCRYLREKRDWLRARRKRAGAGSTYGHETGGA